MAIIHWKIATSGDFNTASNWNPAVVPGSGDDAIIDAVGTYTVTSSTTNTVHALAIVATATLAIGSGTSFSITSGSGTGGIAGTVSVANGAVLSLAGTFTGTGTIQENSSGSSTDIHLASAAVTLQGGGQIAMGDSGNNRIFGNLASNQLINASDTISGSGQLGAGQMTLAVC